MISELVWKKSIIVCPNGVLMGKLLAGLKLESLAALTDPVIVH